MRVRDHPVSHGGTAVHEGQDLVEPANRLARHRGAPTPGRYEDDDRADGQLVATDVAPSDRSATSARSGGRRDGRRRGGRPSRGPRRGRRRSRTAWDRAAGCRWPRTARPWRGRAAACRRPTAVGPWRRCRAGVVQPRLIEVGCAVPAGPVLLDRHRLQPRERSGRVVDEADRLHVGLDDVDLLQRRDDEQLQAELGEQLERVSGGGVRAAPERLVDDGEPEVLGLAPRPIRGRTGRPAMRRGSCRRASPSVRRTCRRSRCSAPTPRGSPCRARMRRRRTSCARR